MQSASENATSKTLAATVGSMAIPFIRYSATAMPLARMAAA